jgi:hypothetical protein
MEIQKTAIKAVSYCIPFELPALNEYINANRSNKYSGAKIKKDIERHICLCIKSQGITTPKIPVYIVYTWRCKDRRKDKDNVAFAKKFILDSLVTCNVLPNDNWDCIQGWTDCFPDPDKNNVGVKVDIWDTVTSLSLIEKG